MTYWLLTTEYPPQSGGGIGTYCYHTAQMLSQKGHQVTVFVPEYSSESLFFENSRAGLRIVHCPVQSVKGLGDEAALSWCFSNHVSNVASQEGQPDFIEFQEYNGIGYFILQKKLLLQDYLNNTRFVVTAHAPGFLYLDYNQAPLFKLPQYWTGEMEKSVLVSADKLISPSQYLLDTLNTYVDLKKQDSRVIPNPYQSPDQPCFDYEYGDFVFFGKLTPQKGAIEMLHYFSKLWDEGFEYTLSIVGGGDHFFYPLMSDLGTHLQRKYLKYVKKKLLFFEGHINPSNLFTRLKKAHVVIIPSIVDNLPYTVLESMSIGKIVLASNQGGHSEIIEHKKSGFIFRHDSNGDNFRTEIKEILDLDQGAIKEISTNAIKRVRDTCGYNVVYEAKIKYLNQIPSRKKQFPFTHPIKSFNHSERKKKNDLLSIIIPYFNLGEYIQETLDSIQKSTYQNSEVLLIDDGSTDKSSIVKLNEIGQTHPNVKIYRKPNTGLSDTRNYGANLATGKFLAFIDADDKISPQYHQKAIHVLETYENISFVGCWGQYFGNSNSIWPSFNPEPPFLLVHNMINSSALVYRTDHFLTSGKNDSQMLYGMEDYDSVINMVKNGYAGVAIPEVLWNYRIRSGSLAQTFNIYSKNYLYRLIAKKHSAFFSEYASEIVNILNSNGPGMNYDNPSMGAEFSKLANNPLLKLMLPNGLRRNDFLRKIAKNFLKHISY